MVLSPEPQPLLEQLGGHLGLDQVLVLGRPLAHGLGGGRAARDGHQGRVGARAAHQGLGRAVGRLDQAELPLQAGQRQHAVLAEGGGELLGGQAVDLVARRR